MTFAATLRLLICLCAAILYAHHARAEVNLAIISTSGAKAGDRVAAGTAKSQKYGVPTATDLVRAGCSQSQCNWDSAGFTWRTFGSLSASEYIDSCRSEVKLNAPTSPEPCTAWGPVSAGLFQDGAVLPLQWTQDAKNADGTTLTDLAGFRIVYGKEANALTQTVEVKDPAARMHTLSGLDYSTSYYVAVKSYNSKGAESDKSNTAQATTAAKPAAPIPPTKPVPPVLSVVETTAYRLDLGSNDQIKATPIGTVPLSTACIRSQPVLDMFLVPRASVRLNRGVNSRPRQIAAKCA